MGSTLDLAVVVRLELAVAERRLRDTARALAEARAAEHEETHDG